MGRELRKVPANWEHPRRDDGSYQPMHDRYYLDVFNDWLNGHNQWEDGSHKDLISDPNLKEEYPFYALYYGNPPTVEYYQSIKFLPEELTHIQLYQNTSEGTPISPVFPAEDLEKLCEYAAEYCTTFADFRATKEEWMKMLKDDFVFHQFGNAIAF